MSIDKYGELIFCSNEMPPDDYDYKCLKVEFEGLETQVSGGDIHDDVEKLRGWKKLLTPLEQQNKTLKKQNKKLVELVNDAVGKFERLGLKTGAQDLRMKLKEVTG